MNIRNHRKLLVVDGKMAVIGSLNCDTRQLSQKYGGENWRELGVSLYGPSVETLAKTFYTVGCLGEKRKAQLKLVDPFIKTNISNSLRREHQSYLVNSIRKSKKKIWVMNPYFAPNSFIKAELADAARRGVDVKIIVPHKSDVSWFPLINTLFFNDLVSQGVKVFEYMPSILHAKVAIFDEHCMLGSSNMNNRTFKHDLEMDVIINEEGSILALERIFLKDLANSQLVDIKKVYKRFPRKNTILTLGKALNYWI